MMNDVTYFRSSDSSADAKHMSDVTLNTKCCKQLLKISFLKLFGVKHLAFHRWFSQLKLCSIVPDFRSCDEQKVNLGCSYNIKFLISKVAKGVEIGKIGNYL